MEKYAASHAAGAAAVMLASFVNVTVRLELAPMTSAVVSVCGFDLPVE